MRIKKTNLGFTLVELLVAIAIFAVLSALGWKIFDYLVKVKDRNAMHEENLGQLQEAYQQVQRDTLQIIPVTASFGQQILPAISLENQKISFSKTGMTDPLKQGISTYERVEYAYNAQDKKLYRLKYANLNLPNSAQPLSSVLLNDVDQYQVTLLNPNELERWPDENTFNERQLPRGIKIKVMIRDVEYEWVFSLLNTDFLRAESKQ
ncbi:type II secretion system minor pseudopilin GspJ [Acinetobacter sichuanensis]|uniref:Type II secretion system protein J n=1 Tax=Acinetobacter sichuanensis TaxID=2136183 RepID=A0A371YKZ9_9GAMM|nr:type II secretion system minor pseudopilin GspJ [Acinetobacter sichuanensis]RFC82153.1 type II secretion system protein GspJ [Acinetobacter sichuanensis]